MTPYLLTLNQAALIFFPSVSRQNKLGCSGGSADYVVQVIIRTKRSRDQKEPSPDVGELSTFFLSQKEISAAVESLVMANILSPLPMSTITMEGANYLLHARRERWTYGQSLKLKWGDRAITPCEHKWVFTLEVKTSSDPVIREAITCV